MYAYTAIYALKFGNTLVGQFYLIAYCQKRHKVDLKQKEAAKILKRWVENGPKRIYTGDPAELAECWVKNRLMELGKFPNLGIQPPDVRLTVVLHVGTMSLSTETYKLDLTDVTLDSWIYANLGLSRSKVSTTNSTIQPIDRVAFRVSEWKLG